MMVCMVGLVAMAQLLAVTLRMQQLGRNSTTAVRHAQDKLDELSAQSFDTGLSIKCGGSLAADATNYNDTVTGYKRRWVVTQGPDGAGEQNIRQVTVRLIPNNLDRRINQPYDLVGFIRGGNFPC